MTTTGAVTACQETCEERHNTRRRKTRQRRTQTTTIHSFNFRQCGRNPSAHTLHTLHSTHTHCTAHWPDTTQHFPAAQTDAAGRVDPRPRAAVSGTRTPAHRRGRAVSRGQRNQHGAAQPHTKFQAPGGAAAPGAAGNRQRGSNRWPQRLTAGVSRHVSGVGGTPSPDARTSTVHPDQKTHKTH